MGTKLPSNLIVLILHGVHHQFAQAAAGSLSLSVCVSAERQLQHNSMIINNAIFKDKGKLMFPLASYDSSSPSFFPRRRLVDVDVDVCVSACGECWV